MAFLPKEPSSVSSLNERPLLRTDESCSSLPTWSFCAPQLVVSTPAHPPHSWTRLKAHGRSFRGAGSDGDMASLC